MTSQDQAHINKALFEVVISLYNRVNDLTFQVRALRILQEAGGAEPVPPEHFQAVVKAAREQVGPETTAVLQRLQQIADVLGLPRH